MGAGIAEGRANRQAFEALRQTLRTVAAARNRRDAARRCATNWIVKRSKALLKQLERPH